MPDHTDDLAAADDQQEHYAYRQIQVLIADPEAKRQPIAKQTNHQRGQSSPDDGPLSAG